jgi:hypothetical protein
VAAGVFAQPRPIRDIGDTIAAWPNPWFARQDPMGHSPYASSAAETKKNGIGCHNSETMANPTEAKQATDSIDKLAGADWYAIFKELHAALILDVAAQKKDAARHYERSYKLDPTALRVVQSYGSFLSRQGNTADALSGWDPKSAKCDADHIGRGAFLICLGSRDVSLGRRRDAITRTSDSTSVLLRAILGTLLVMSWIYIPA